MAMKDVDSRFAVLKAMAEYRDLGQNPFLLKYGFGKAKEYRILFEGIEYDSKAIVGVAHKYQFGKPLTSKEFNGG